MSVASFPVFVQVVPKRLGAEVFCGSLEPFRVLGKLEAFPSVIQQRLAKPWTVQSIHTQFHTFGQCSVNSGPTPGCSLNCEMELESSCIFKSHYLCLVLNNVNVSIGLKYSPMPLQSMLLVDSNSNNLIMS